MRGLDSCKNVLGSHSRSFDDLTRCRSPSDWLTGGRFGVVRAIGAFSQGLLGAALAGAVMSLCLGRYPWTLARLVGLDNVAATAYQAHTNVLAGRLDEIEGHTC
ncbi:hypothetical protein BDN67DRAFT_966802 [Paxillus ammoniavirescens]|nr:hypothetical protein BDN67DRAFT_966802 [Paxillus ammoniavirescens]